jgi:hypothetical protein
VDHSDLVENLVNISDATFHSALGQLSSINSLSEATRVGIVMEVAKRLMARGEIGERVQADRIHAILRRIGLGSSALSDLAVNARELPPGQRNAIAGFLAPNQRRLLLGRRTDAEVTSPITDVLQPSIEAGLFEAVSPTDSSFSTVVLFTGPQDANKKLLSARGYGPLAWSSLDSVRQDLDQNGDVCACLVEGSALQALDKEAQRGLFNLLGSYSTFLWIRIEDRFLKLKPMEIRECLRSARCMREEVPAGLLSIQPEATLRESEIQDIDAASEALRARATAEFIPGEISEAQATILMAAVKIHARELQIEGRVELKSLETRFLSEGRSTARIAILRANKNEWPVVAKIDSKDRVLDEMRRFRTFIEPWDNELRPKLHFHGESAVLLFGLVPDERDPFRPAEVLSTRLDSLWNDQIFASKSEQELTREREALAEGAENAARKLGNLNSLRPRASNLPPRGNPHINIFEALANSGVDWGLPACARAALLKAQDRFRRFDSSATVHGDVHLKNILLRDDRRPHLIDYAGSGPGHPGVDLARLELALFLGPFRQVGSEEDCAAYQRALTFDGASLASLEQRFARLYRCHVNAVCLRGCGVARDMALSVLSSYGGEAADYHAAKYLVAWQNLVMMGRQTGLARATIAVLAPEISNW